MAPSHVVVTPSDKGPIVNIVTWLFVIAAACTAVTKLATKLVKYKRFHGDDYGAIASLVFNAASAIVVSVQVSCGLGRHIDSLSMQQKSAFQKANYSMDILFVISMVLPKLTILQFLSTLAIGKARHNIVLGTTGFTMIWCFISLLVVAFPCSAPNTWDRLNSRCIDEANFWAVYAAVDTATNVVLCIMPIYITLKIQISTKKKVGVALAFAGSFCVIPPIIARSVLIKRSTGSVDATWDSTTSVLLGQVSINLALIAACIAFVKPFLDSVYTGMLSADLRTGTNLTDGTGQGSRKAKILRALDISHRTSKHQPHSSNSELHQLTGLDHEQDMPAGSPRVIHSATVNSAPVPAVIKGRSVSPAAFQHNIGGGSSKGAIGKTVDIDVYTG